MENINFMTLSRLECLEVYTLIHENSKDKFEEAGILAERGRYNTASSLLIVSNEELLKGLILFLDGNGFNIRNIKGIKGLFNNHKLRYLFALVISVMSIFSKELSSFLFKMMTGESDFLEKIDPANPLFNQRIKNYLMERLSDIKAEIEFFSKVDKARQQGLYSDYRNGLIKITSEEYSELFQKISTLNTAVMAFMVSFDFNDSNLITHIEKLKNDMDFKYRKNLEMVIKKINSPKVNSYESMLEMVNTVYFELQNNNEVVDFLDEDAKNFSKIIEGVKNSKKLPSGSTNR